MFDLPPKDKYSPIVTKLNLFTIIYLPILSFIIYFTNNHFKLGKYENISVVSVLGVLELSKYFLFKRAVTYLDAKSKQKRSSKLEKLWKVFLFNLQMVGVIYAVAILLGAQLLDKCQETLMFSILLMTLAVLPITLYMEVDDVCHLLGILTVKPTTTYSNLFVCQLKMTLFGAWLGATVIPLDWNKEWQIWPNSCIYGALAGFYISNVYFYIINSNFVITRTKKNQKFKNVL